MRASPRKKKPFHPVITELNKSPTDGITKVLGRIILQWTAKLDGKVATQPKAHRPCVEPPRKWPHGAYFSPLGQKHKKNECNSFETEHVTSVRRYRIASRPWRL